MLRPRPVARALAGLALTWAAACSSSATTDPELSTALTVTRETVRVRACEGPASSLPAALAAGLPAPPDPAAPSGPYTIDDYLSAVARRTPGGFAGVYYDANGTRPVLLLTDPSRAAEAKAALAGRVPSFDVAGAEVRAARWDFAQLYDWYRHLQRRGIWAAGVGLTVSDIDERANRLYFGAADQAARDRLAERLSAMDLPCDLILVGVTPPAELR